MDEANGTGRCGICLPGLLQIVYLLITIMVLAASHPHLVAQEVTSQALPGESFPDAPGTAAYPTAVVLPPTAEGSTATIESSGPQSKSGSLMVADRDVLVT